MLRCSKHRHDNAGCKCAKSENGGSSTIKLEAKVIRVTRLCGGSDVTLSPVAMASLEIVGLVGLKLKLKRFT